MSKSVLDLQNDCLNHSIPCSQLLLKAYAIARKLKNEQMAVFCKKELNGYEDNPSGVPNYRVINISLEVQHGPVWQTVIVPNNSYLSKYNVTQSVKELETLCSQGKNYYTAKLSSEELIHLRSVCQNANILDGHKKIPAYHFDGIIYKVRHILLEWALKLGDDGIWGDNLEFTSNEMEKAKNTTVINNFGNINGANLIGSMINSSATISNNSFDFEALKQLITKIETDLENAKNIDAEKTDSLKEQIASLKKSVEEQNETSAMDLLKNIATGAISSGIWSIGTTITNFISSITG